MAGYNGTRRNSINFDHFDQFTQNLFGGGVIVATAANGSGNTISTPTAAPLQTRYAWLFDNNNASGEYLTNESANHVVFSGSVHALQTARVVIKNIFPFPDNGSTFSGLFQVIDQKAGNSVPSYWNEIRVMLYCSDVKNKTHSATSLSCGVQDANGWNVVFFPMPAIPMFTLIMEFTAPTTWNIWVYDPATNIATRQILTMAWGANIANVGDNLQIVNAGTLLLPDGTGHFSRNNASNYGSFGGSFSDIWTFLETGANVRAATGFWFQNPQLTAAAGSPIPLAMYLYDADHTVYGANNIEMYAPNNFTSRYTGAQHLKFGGNSNLGVAQSTAPVRILF